MTRTRALILMALSIALITFMVTTGHRDLRLMIGRVTTTARVTAVHQPPRGRIRESDIEVTYEFLDRSGVWRTGTDALPPAAGRPEAGRIDVAYSARDPSVSRIASQVSVTPVTALLMGVVLFAQSLYAILRAGRASTRQQRPPSLP
jgi:hypothetical protein